MIYFISLQWKLQRLYIEFTNEVAV